MSLQNSILPFMSGPETRAEIITSSSPSASIGEQLFVQEQQPGIEAGTLVRPTSELIILPQGPHIREGYTDGYMLVAPQRATRDLSALSNPIKEQELEAHPANCPLCPGNLRKNGKRNPNYTGTYVFDNDTPAVYPPPEGVQQEFWPYLRRGDKVSPEYGICRVLISDPRHNINMMHMKPKEIEEVIRMLADQYRDLGSKPYIGHVALFETRGPRHGNTQFHPHWQGWGTTHIPPKMLMRIREQMDGGVDLLHDARDAVGLQGGSPYNSKTLQAVADRLVWANESMAILVEYAARSPYGVSIVPLDRVSSIDMLNDTQVTHLAQAFWVVTNTWASFFQRPKNGADYMFGIHQLPTYDEARSSLRDFQMSISCAQYELRPGVAKVEAGYEYHFGYQRDLTPEQAGQDLREVAQSLIIP